MNSSPDLLIHIGYHKTGTTLLQRRVFGAEKSGFSRIGNATDLDTVIVKSANFSFDSVGTRALAAPEISAAGERGEIPVLSHERFSGYPHRGGYDSKLVADRLYETFPNARILIAIREQGSMIPSLYKTYIRMGGVATLRDYLPGHLDTGSSLFRFDYLEYDRLIGYYQSLFGKGRVMVLPYELLEARPQLFLRRIRNFSRNTSSEAIRMPKVNVSPSALTLRSMRHVNKLVVCTIHNPSPFLPVRVNNLTVRSFMARMDLKLPGFLRRIGEGRWEEYVADRIGDRYRESNSRTEALTGLDLGSYGYDCG